MNSIMANIKQNHNYLNLNILLLKMALIWPLETKIFRTAHKVFQYSTAFILFSVSVGQFMAILKTNDLRLISSTVDVFTLTASAMYKQLFVAGNIVSMRYIVDVIHKDFYEMPLVENKAKRPKTFRMKHHLRYAGLFSKIHVTSAVILAVIWCFGPLLVKPQMSLNPARNPGENLTIPAFGNETSYNGPSSFGSPHGSDLLEYPLFVQTNVLLFGNDTESNSGRKNNIENRNEPKSDTEKSSGQSGDISAYDDKNDIGKAKTQNGQSGYTANDKNAIGKPQTNNEQSGDIANENDSHKAQSGNFDGIRTQTSQTTSPTPQGSDRLRKGSKGEVDSKHSVQYDSLNQRRILPMNVWTAGISYHNSPWYEIMFGIQFWAMLMSSVIYLAIDAFYFSIIYICCGQLQLIHISMENMFPPEGDGSDGTKGRDGSDGRGRDRMVRLINEIDNARLCKIARLHAHVLRLVRFLEQTFTSTIMVDFLHAVTSLSFALFHFQTAQGLVEFTKMYVFLIVCILHQFLNNYFGEIMKYWQSQLSYSTYETPWYFRDRQFKKSIQIITARTRVPIMLNGLKMYVLCLASFIEFMKRIFSYYTVLREISK
uniref:Odorant receptor 12 n=1 Tax=Diaphorina citri TaxID=121845 RepID=A0A7T3R198_DIACI|nr:odorant receptor 12 [Diaphorina citri]